MTRKVIQLTAKYIASTYGTEVKWCVSGRRLDALRAVAEEALKSAGEAARGNLDIVVADASK